MITNTSIMKKWITLTAALLLAFGLSAQYKKASFFDKEGRTYEFGPQLYNFGDGKGSPIGFKIGFGRDRDNKRLFTSWELQFIPSYKYSYHTTDENDESVLVNGTSKAQFIYAFHYNYHLLKAGEEERIVRPFLTAGFNIVIASGAKTENRTPESAYNLKKEVIGQAFSSGIGGGLGTLINFTPKLGLKLQGGYTWEIHMGTYDFSGKGYYMFTNHPYVSLSFRVRIVKD